MKSKALTNPIYCIISILLILTAVIVFRNNFYRKSSIPPKVILRCDDIGIGKSVNEAIEELAEKKIPVSASVIVVSKYFSKAVDILKRHPEISVGVHLVFTSEWENERWKPLLPKNEVSSLVDSGGYFYPSRISLYNANPDTVEIEKEADAQVRKILGSGLKVDYIDCHMFFLYSQIGNNILKRLGKKYNLLISQMNNELLLNNLFKAEANEKTEKYIDLLSDLKYGETYIIVLHLAAYPDELNSMKDLDNPLFTKNGDDRYGEFYAVISDKASQFIREKNIRLITYSNIYSFRK